MGPGRPNLGMVDLEAQADLFVQHDFRRDAHVPAVALRVVDRVLIAGGDQMVVDVIAPGVSPVRPET